MGHSQMLLAVAGIDAPGIVDLTRRLASGDWSSFPPEHAAAFRAAALLTRAPEAFGHAQRAELRAAAGAHALDLIWLIAWGNYMTTVADALQLPLEAENAFQVRGDPATVVVPPALEPRPNSTTMPEPERSHLVGPGEADRGSAFTASMPAKAKHR